MFLTAFAEATNDRSMPYRDVPESIFYRIPDIWTVFFIGSGTGYRTFNKLEEQLNYAKWLLAEMRSLFRWIRKSKYKKILNTEHKFATLYIINSAHNIFIYYSVQYFTLKKLNLLVPIIFRIRLIPDSEIYGRYRIPNGYPIHP